MFFDGFFVDYDSADQVEFIELAPSGHFTALFDGVSLHRLPADAALALVGRYASHDPLDPELGYSYIFPKIQLSLWRAVVPEPDQDPHDSTGRYFEAVGVGVRDYFGPSR